MTMQSQPVHVETTTTGRSIGKLLLVLVVVGAVGYAVYHDLAASSSEPQLKSEPIIERVENIGKLAVLKVFVSDIVSTDDAGFLSGVEGIWIIKGDAILTVDFARIQVLAKDDTAKTVRLRLAPPQVELARVDHDRSGVYKLDKGVFTGTKEAAKMTDHAFKAGQENVRELAGLKDNIEAAKRNAEELLKNHLRMVEWEATVEWQAE
jgi:hypothetical protein